MASTFTIGAGISTLDHGQIALAANANSGGNTAVNLARNGRARPRHFKISRYILNHYFTNNNTYLFLINNVFSYVLQQPLLSSRYLILVDRLLVMLKPALALLS
jgi:hypothetical protein